MCHTSSARLAATKRHGLGGMVAVFLPIRTSERRSPRIDAHRSDIAPSTGICLVYKTESKPWSINGGTEGEPNQIVINPGTDREVIKAGSYNLLDTGEVLANNTGGGGGYGDPFERDPARVSADVRNGFVSAAAASREYGVVVDASTFAIDEEATHRLRSRSETAG